MILWKAKMYLSYHECGNVCSRNWILYVETSSSLHHSLPLLLVFFRPSIHHSQVHHNPSPAYESLVLDMRRLLRAVWLSRPLACFEHRASTSSHIKPPVLASSSSAVPTSNHATSTHNSQARSPRTKAMPAQNLPPLRDSALVAVAEKLPLTCAYPPATHGSASSSSSSGDSGSRSSDSSDSSRRSTINNNPSVLEAMSQSSTAEWYRRSGARAPAKPLHAPVSICLVNEGALTREHWAQITALLPTCLGMEN